MNDIIMESVSDAIEESEIDVLLAIGESYCKYISLLNNFEDDQIIQEMASPLLFMEDFGENVNHDKDYSREGVINKIKIFFRNVFNYIKKGLSKVVSFFTKKFDIYRSKVIGTINICNLANRIVKSNYVVTESFIQEEMDSATYKELIKQANEKKAAVKRELNESEKGHVKHILKSEYVDALNKRILTDHELDEFVKVFQEMSSKEDYEKLKMNLDSIQKNNSSDFENIMKVQQGMLDSITKQLDQIRDSETKFIDDWMREEKTEKMGEKEIEMRLELIEKFSNSLGSLFNEIFKTDTFSKGNIEKLFFGQGGSFNSFEAVSNGLKYAMNAIIKVKTGSKTLIKSLDAYGDKLYRSHIDFDDAVFENEMKRKELGMKTDKTIKLILFSLDQIKEESYGYTDDKLFNKRSYDFFNPVSAYLGGPFTMIMKTVVTFIAGPLSLVPGPSDFLSFAVFRKLCVSMNRTGKHLVSYREASKGKHMQKAMEGMSHDEKMDIIKKSRDEMQRETREKELASAKAKGR